MKVLAVLLALACTFLYVEAQNVVCGTENTSNTVTVEDGDSYSFKTQKGKKYKGNTECTVDYKMGDSCAKMSFVCTKLNINNKNKKKCSKGDKLTVNADGKSKAYCKKNKPKVTSTSDMSVVFTSNAKKHATGATCQVTCTEAASTTGNTTDGTCGEKVMADNCKVDCSCLSTNCAGFNIEACTGGNGCNQINKITYCSDSGLSWIQPEAKEGASCTLKCENASKDVTNLDVKITCTKKGDNYEWDTPPAIASKCGTN